MQQWSEWQLLVRLSGVPRAPSAPPAWRCRPRPGFRYALAYPQNTRRQGSPGSVSRRGQPPRDHGSLPIGVDRSKVSESDPAAASFGSCYVATVRWRDALRAKQPCQRHRKSWKEIGGQDIIPREFTGNFVGQVSQNQRQHRAPLGIYDPVVLDTRARILLALSHRVSRFLLLR